MADNFPEWKRAVESLGRRIEAVAAKAVAVAGLAFVKEAKAKLVSTYKGGQTGTLSRSIQTRPVIRQGNLFTVIIGTRMIYARIQEFGGIIRPVTKKWLHWHSGGKTRDIGHAHPHESNALMGTAVFAKRVKIPAKGYFAAANAQKAKYREIMVKVLSQALAKK